MKQRIVKQQKHTEQYQRTKLQASIHAACMSVQDLSGSAELTSENVCDQLEDWLETKMEVTSSDIRSTAAGILQRYNPSAAFAYERHMDIN